MSTVLAILQNCWFKPGTNPEIIRRYQEDQKFRRLVLARCMTGRRLSRAFGEHYQNIWWENASTYVGNQSSSRGEFDPNHIKLVIEKVEPVAILTFGMVAYNGVTFVEDEWNRNLDRIYQGDAPEDEIFPTIHHSHHPNARGITQAQLNNFAEEVIRKYLTIPS